VRFPETSKSKKPLPALGLKGGRMEQYYRKLVRIGAWKRVREQEIWLLKNVATTKILIQ